MEKKEKILFIDDLNRQWKVGYLEEEEEEQNKTPQFTKDGEIYVIDLPCFAYSMYPENQISSDDLYFCKCFSCFSSLEKGNICLLIYMTNNIWKVGLKCEKCAQNISENKCKLPITHVLDAIYPIILKGITEIKTHQCLVCERPKCKNTECVKGMDTLYANEIEKTLEHFYLIGLNIVRPLLGKKFKNDRTMWREYMKG